MLAHVETTFVRIATGEIQTQPYLHRRRPQEGDKGLLLSKHPPVNIYPETAIVRCNPDMRAALSAQKGQHGQLAARTSR